MIKILTRTGKFSLNHRRKTAPDRLASKRSWDSARIDSRGERLDTNPELLDCQSSESSRYVGVMYITKQMEALPAEIGVRKIGNCKNDSFPVSP